MSPPTTDPNERRVIRKGMSAHPFSDLYHALLVMPWGRFVALLILLFLSVNALFATAYFVDVGGVQNARSFLDCFYFSVQTMATIGYGGMTPQSHLANTLVTIEALTGMLTTAMATGLMFAKFARPTARVQFSRVVTLGPRDGRPTLAVRAANARGNQIVEAQASLNVMFPSVSAEGERYMRLVELRLVRAKTPLFQLSWTIMHVIDEQSPLHGLDSADFEARGIEFAVTLVGTDETFAQTVSARRRYRASDVRWGARFSDILLRLPTGDVELDFTHLDDVVPLDAPRSPTGPP